MKKIDKGSYIIVIIILLLGIIIRNFSSSNFSITEDGSLNLVKQTWWGLKESDYELKNEGTQWYIRKYHEGNLFTGNTGVTQWEELFIDGLQYSWTDQ